MPIETFACFVPLACLSSRPVCCRLLTRPQLLVRFSATGGRSPISRVDAPLIRRVACEHVLRGRPSLSLLACGGTGFRTH
jgi:hypothetical protein